MLFDVNWYRNLQIKVNKRSSWSISIEQQFSCSLVFDAHSMRCAIEEKGEETGTLWDNLNGFWNVERIGSSGELVINKLEKDICQDAKRYIKYKIFPLKPEHDLFIT